MLSYKFNILAWNLSAIIAWGRFWTRVCYWRLYIVIILLLTLGILRNLGGGLFLCTLKSKGKFLSNFLQTNYLSNSFLSAKNYMRNEGPQTVLQCVTSKLSPWTWIQELVRGCLGHRFNQSFQKFWFFFFLLQVYLFFMFLDRFNVLMSKINFKK